MENASTVEKNDQLGRSNSENKMNVERVLNPHTGRDGVRVTLINGYNAFMPSFEDLYRIVCHAHNGTPSSIASLDRFLQACVLCGTFEELRQALNLTTSQPCNLEVQTKFMRFERNKFWVYVKVADGGTQFYMTYEGVFLVVSAICKCEDLKYPQELGYKGRRMVAEFLHDCLYEPYPVLSKKYRLPIRKGAVTVDPNGANLN